MNANWITKNAQVKITLEERPAQEPLERPVVLQNESMGGMGEPSIQGDEETPMMSKAERDRMREELMKLFEQDTATQ